MRKTLQENKWFQIATEGTSHSEGGYRGVATRPLKATYRAVAFTGSVPGSDRARTVPRIADQTSFL
ncbi:hypothetical protein Taro_002968 [Colocasia esculenta]|uniref:Uncharacterized protein n=1 Tax=Colocasia esculenta TaxID=4460 RepID=A0A843TMG0_COLES|nr:hypothetical protein [Colocasia esculenta]